MVTISWRIIVSFICFNYKRWTDWNMKLVITCITKTSSKPDVGSTNIYNDFILILFNIWNITIAYYRGPPKGVVVKRIADTYFGKTISYQKRFLCDQLGQFRFQSVHLTLKQNINCKQIHTQFKYMLRNQAQFAQFEVVQLYPFKKFSRKCTTCLYLLH
jgi:hypothetical protein